MAKKSKVDGVRRALERAGALCLAFANTGVPRRDDRRKGSKAPPSMPLERYAELVTWSQRTGILAAIDAERLRAFAAKRPEDAAAVRARALELRAAIVRIFTALALDKEPRSGDFAIMNRLLRLRRAVPAGDGFRWGWMGDEDALDRPLWAVAQSAADLLVSDERAFVRQCGGSGCRQLFISRNRQRFWCDMNTCGNRAKGRRQRRFQRYATETTLRRKLPSGLGAPSGSGGAREMEGDEILTPTAAKKRLGDLQPTENDSPERLVVTQPTILDSPQRLVVDVTAEREPEEGLDAAQPTARKPQRRLG